MDWIKTIRVVEICLPIFGLIALGKVLYLKNILRDEHKNFINYMVFNFCLPALVFAKVVSQKPSSFIDSKIALGTVLPVLIVAFIYLILARVFKLKGSFAAAFVFGSYYANTAYIGFPLSEEAFGGAGLATASFYNAICIPFFLILTFIIIAIYGAGKRAEGFSDRLKKVIFNPFIIAVLLGFALSFILTGYRGADGQLDLPAYMISIGSVIAKLCEMLGGMGLPLALLSIGGALKFAEITEGAVPLAIDLFGKLVVFPGVAFLLFKYFLTGLDPALSGTVIILHATPNAVVSYIIARQIGVSEGFVSAQLVISTCLSAISIPIWLYILL